MVVKWLIIAFHIIVEQWALMVNLAGVIVTLQHHVSAKVQFFVTMDTIIMVVGWVILAINHGIIVLQFAMNTAPEICNGATMDMMTWAVI